MVILSQTVASQKHPAACLPEERVHLHISYDKARISRECQEDLEIVKSEDDLCL